MAGTLAGKVAIVTGAARGIGRSEAFALAEQGAHVVVNDLGLTPEQRAETEAAVEEIRASGGSAEANGNDISSWDGARALIEQAVAHSGHLDILVCNAGNLRDRTLANMEEDEWDAVIRVHMKGHFAPLRFAAAHWRERSRASGEPIDARAIFTSSEAGLFGNFGQVNYSSAKAGIVGMAMVAARELAKTGVKVNVICPRARTQMTIGVVPDMDPVAGSVDEWDPNSISTFATFLAGPNAADISGDVFVVHGATVKRMGVWTPIGGFVDDKALTLDGLAAGKASLAGSSGFGLPDFVELMNRPAPS